MEDLPDQYIAAEAAARREIDEQLVECGWSVQNAANLNLGASRGVAVWEFILEEGHGRADYLLYVDGQTNMRSNVAVNGTTRINRTSQNPGGGKLG